MNEKLDLDIICYEHGSKGAVIIYISSKEFHENTEKIFSEIIAKTDKDFILLELLVNDWDRFLTPWQVSECLKDRNFSGDGGLLLKKIRDEIIAVIDDKYPSHKDIYIAGYSLAGLFSLWAYYEEGRFAGAMSASGSLWYPGWDKYIEEKKIKEACECGGNVRKSAKRKAKIYLSLGNKENKSKNQYMSQVLKKTDLQQQLLREDDNVESVTFVTEEGGHFTNVWDRIVRGMVWLLGQS